MKHLSPEILLSIFKTLNSREMVKMMRVCKSWFQIIEANKTLWRRLVLPDNHEGWMPSIAEMFGENSGNTLEEVEIKLALSHEGYSKLAETFERSKQTLKSLCLLDYWRKNDTLTRRLWGFPHLVDGRLISGFQPRVRLSEKGIEDGDHQDSRVHLSKLKVLWINYYEDSFAPRFQPLDNLSSLHIGDPVDSKECRKILENPSRTLKHLDVTISNPANLDLPPLNFTQLQVLGIRADYSPSWMKIPHSSTVIAQPHGRSGSSALYNSLPSVSTLCMGAYKGVKGLSTRCPNLSTLRLYELFMTHISSTYVEELVKMLKDRRTNAEAQMKVGGVEMVAIKTLIVPFSYCETDDISELSALEEEVLDGDTQPKHIEMEI